MLKPEAQNLISDDSHPHSAAVADFNNDGLPDIVVANSGTNNIGVFLRYGNGTFANQMTYPTGLYSVPYSVAVGDFNKDQRPDIVVANFGTNNIGIFLGTDNGTFKSQTTFSTGSSRPRWVAVGDFNNDTVLDITVVNYGTNNIGILLGYGDGTFARQITSSTGYDSLPISLVVNDFNNDGQLDIAVANYGTNNVGVFLGHGNGTFVTETTYSTGTNSDPLSIDAGDFNNDTHLDLVVVNFGKNNVAVLLGYGNGSFTVPTTYSTGNNSSPRSAAVGDFDNDKQLDIVVANYGTLSVGIFVGHGNGTFADQLIYFTSNGYNPYFLATGDFNNDSRLDIAVINYDNNYVDILLTYRNASFSNQTTYPTGLNSAPVSIALADLNNDNRLDIVVANNGASNIGIFVGYGNGTFSTQTTYSAGSGSGPHSVAVSDFNNDRRLDVVIANVGTSNIGIFLGYGDGTLSNQTTYSTGTYSLPYAVIVDDFNNDSRLDIAVANYWTSNVGIFVGYGNGTFSGQTTYSTGSGSAPCSIASGDLNNDGWLDIAVANYWANSIGIFLGFGNGTFTAQIIYLTGSGSGPIAVAFGDLNEDNRLDIVVANYLTNNIGVFLGYGNGILSSQVTFSTGNGSSPISVAIADFNNDGQLDIVVTNLNTDNVGIFIGYGNSSFSSQKVYSTGRDSHPYNIAVGDLNNDGRSDIAVVNYGTSNTAILLGYDGSFASPKTYSTRYPSNPYSVAVSDFNSDGRLDMVITNFLGSNIDVFLGYGDGTFLPQTSYLTGYGSGPYDVAIGDFNNDSRLDIVVANYFAFNIGIYLGHGDGTFSNQITYSTGQNSCPQSITTGDFNNDIRLDIAVANLCTGNFGIFLGYGNGTFSNQATFSTGNNVPLTFDIAVGDFNSDSRLDVTVVNYAESNLGVFLGYGNGSFSNQIIYTIGSGSGPCAVAVSDFNKDSRLDIVVRICFNNEISILLGYGDGTFFNSATYPLDGGLLPKSIVIGDWNNDSRLDIAVADYNTDSVGVFLGYGDGTFLNQRTYSTGTSSHPKSIACGDFNNDRVLDIVVANSNTSTTGIFLGLSYINGLRENTYSTGSSPHPRTLALGDFNNDAQVDIAVANYGLSNIGILFGYADETYPKQAQFSVGSLSFPTSVAVGDFNHDGELDIAVANSGTENIGVLYGYGNGSFMSLATYSTGDSSMPLSVAIGDFSNDKRFDIAVASNGTNSVNVFLRYDNGAFNKQIEYTTGTDSYPIGVAVSDFNNDDWLDFAVTNKGTDSVGVFLSLGNGTFSRQVSYSTGAGSSPWAIVVDDFNNDKQVDIVVTNYWTNTVGIFLGFGNGTFSIQTTYSTGDGSGPLSAAISDFNNDSHLDIVVTNYWTNNIGIFLGFGNGTFSSQIIYSTGSGSYPVSVAIGDLNNDRQPDIVVANFRTSNIAIFLGCGNNTFSNQIIYSTGSGFYSDSVAIGDFNNDSQVDIAVANYGANNIGILFGYGNGSFSSQTTYSTGNNSGPQWIIVADFNGDIQLDIAVVNIGDNNLGVLLGCANGTFFSQLTYSTGDYSQPHELAVGDFNKDGRLDVITANYGTNNVGLFLGYVSESFLSAPAYSTGLPSPPVYIAVGDFNNDTRLDIVVANNGSDNIMIFFGSGYGTFVSETTYSTGNGSHPCWVAVGDLNNDSQMDIVVANSGTDNVGVFLNNGDGTFSTQATHFIALRSQPYSVGVVDIDNDTQLDIVVANYGSNSVSVFLGYGNGSFASQQVFGTGFGSHPFGLVVGNVNKDNLMDVVITNDGYGNINILSKNC